jgi:hypothetical protein
LDAPAPKQRVFIRFLKFYLCCDEMNKIVLKIALIFSLLGFFGFVTASILSRTNAGLENSADLISHFSAGLFISAFFILFFAGLVICIGYVFRQIHAFFSSRAIIERKSLFYLNKLQQQQMLYEFKKAKLIFLAQQKRKRLMQKWLSSSNRA